MDLNPEIIYDNATLNYSDVIKKLSPFITENRKKRIFDVIKNRTKNIVPVFDGLYDHGNVSAVLRSAESFGFQTCHVIETQERFKTARSVSNGAEKWLEITKWKNPVLCANSLKETGYQIISTHLDASAAISEVDFSKPTAIVFGNEKEGVSEDMLKVSDARVKIPMQGFSQSFNISVAAAISFYHIYLDRLRKGIQGDLSESDKRILEAKYYLFSVDNPLRYW